MQFISEFIVESVEYLERIANPNPPPLDIGAIEKMKTLFDTDGDMDVFRPSLKAMEDAFCQPGDLSLWTQDLLDEIDQCFVKNYVGEDEQPVPSLFFPDSPDNMNRFIAYCSDVDVVFRRNSETAPRYAREYFMFYSIWQLRPWGFPMPLGTASVVGVLNAMTKTVEIGFSEVSPHTVRTDGSRPSIEPAPCTGPCHVHGPNLHTPIHADLRDQGDILGGHHRVMVRANRCKGLYFTRPVRIHDRCPAR